MLGKKAEVKFINQTGDSVSRVVTPHKLIFHFDESKVEIIHALVKDEAAIAKGFQPELTSQSVKLDLNDPQDAAIINAMTGRLWEKALVQPFVKDYSETGEDGKVKAVVKTLKDLKAVVKDVPLPTTPPQANPLAELRGKNQ